MFHVMGSLWDTLSRGWRRRETSIPSGSGVVVGILDRDEWTACTDNIVVVDPAARRLTWIPRDLWSAAAGDRINGAFRQGGHALLQAAIGEAGFPVTASVVFRRSAIERALAGVSLTVPVDRLRRYWYPLAPTRRIEDGAKLVAFLPPSEHLEGERLHQWLGARTGADVPPIPLPDLDRIDRQRILLRCYLEQHGPAARAIADPTLVSVSDDAAMARLAKVRPDWTFAALTDVEPVTIAGKMVLRRRRRFFRRFRTRQARGSTG